MEGYIISLGGKDFFLYRLPIKLVTQENRDVDDISNDAPKITMQDIKILSKSRICSEKCE